MRQFLGLGRSDRQQVQVRGGNVPARAGQRRKRTWQGKRRVRRYRACRYKPCCCKLRLGFPPSPCLGQSSWTFIRAPSCQHKLSRDGGRTNRRRQRIKITWSPSSMHWPGQQPTGNCKAQVRGGNVPARAGQRRKRTWQEQSEHKSTGDASAAEVDSLPRVWQKVLLKRSGNNAWRRSRPGRPTGW